MANPSNVMPSPSKCMSPRGSLASTSNASITSESLGSYGTPTRSGESNRSSVRVYRKESGDKLMSAFMPGRVYAERPTGVDPVEVVVLMARGSMRAEKNLEIYAQMQCVIQGGNDDWDTLSIPVEKVVHKQRMRVHPLMSEDDETPNTPFHSYLRQKYGVDAIPITVAIPPGLPSTAYIHAINGKSQCKSKSSGVTFKLSLTYNTPAVPKDKDEASRTINFYFRKVSCLPKYPAIIDSMPFEIPGLQISLDKQIYYPGDVVTVTALVLNTSFWAIKKIRCQLEQHIELRLEKSQKGWTTQSTLSSSATKQGCPIGKNATVTATFTHTLRLPEAGQGDKLATNTLVAADGWDAKDGVELAASAALHEFESGYGKGRQLEQVGLEVQYMVTVTCKRIGGILTLSVPVILCGALATDPFVAAARPTEVGRRASFDAQSDPSSFAMSRDAPRRASLSLDSRPSRGLGVAFARTASTNSEVIHEAVDESEAPRRSALSTVSRISEDASEALEESRGSGDGSVFSAGADQDASERRKGSSTPSDSGTSGHSVAECATVCPPVT
eukprot:Opistho-2@69336